MTKKIIILFTITVLVVIGVTLGIYFIDRNKETKGGVTSTSTINIAQFFPFGGSETEKPTSTPSIIATSTNTSTQGTALPRLRRISGEPVSGILGRGMSTSSQAVYTEKATGHIYIYDLSTGSTEKLSNTTLPKIQQSFFNKTGDKTIFSYLNADNETKESLYASIKKTTKGTSTEPITIQGSFLSRNIVSLAISPKGDRIVFSNKNGGVSIANIDGSKQTSLYDSPIGEWTVSWPTESMITLTTKPSATIEGFVYSIDPKTPNNIKRIIGKIPGLTTLTDNTGANILYSQSTTRGIIASIKNIKTNTFLSINNPTLPEKCIWSNKEFGILYCAIPVIIPSASYPDDWYKGLISFTDSLYKIDTKTQEINLISDIPKETGQNIDIIDPSLNNDENFLVFINKKDSTPWLFDLKAKAPQN